MTDTGSLEPLPEAVVWSERADAWAQRPATPEPGPWSEVAPTGRPVFPQEGVGWRSETAEWQSTTDTARWRTTTEWRSSEGTAGWRSTTEAWQTGGNREGRRPPTEPPTRLPAISGTAWPTPAATEQAWPASAATPTPSRQGPDPTPAWQSPEPASSWQSPQQAPPWQSPQPTPSWQSPQQAPPWQSAEPTPPWQDPEPRQPWQQQARSPENRSPDSLQQETRPPWQQPTTPVPSWQAPPESEPTWQTRAEPSATWQQPAPQAPPAWQQPSQAPPAWQQAPPAWQAPAEPTPTWQQPSEPRQGWQQLDEPAPTWQQAAPSWQPVVEPPPIRWTQPDPQSSWQETSESSAAPWQPDPRAARSIEAPPTPAGPQAATYTGSWSAPAYDDGRHLVRDDDRAQWRREYDEDGRQGGRRRAADPGGAPSGGTGWTAASGSDNWAEHSYTTEMSLYQDRGVVDDPVRREPRRGPASSRGPREEPDSGSWERDEDSTATQVRRPPAEPGDWRRAEAANGAASYREGHTDDWRREMAAETGLADGQSRRFPTSDFPPFQAPGTTGSGAVDRAAPRALGAAPMAPPRDGVRPREELLVGASPGGGSWQSAPDTQWPPRGGGQRTAGVAGPYERRPVGGVTDPSGRRNLLDEADEEIEEVTGGPLAAVGYTALWYGVPVVLVIVYMLVLDTQQSHALATLVKAIPQFALSLALSMAMAAGLRWISGSWKAASVGLAAAVMGGGLATVLMSAITDQSLS